MEPVTRVEIVEAVYPAFEPTTTPTTTLDLRWAAQQTNARAEVIETLQNLDEDLRFHSIRDIWKHLPDIPVGQ